MDWSKYFLVVGIFADGHLQFFAVAVVDVVVVAVVDVVVADGGTVPVIWFWFWIC